MPVAVGVCGSFSTMALVTGLSGLKGSAGIGVSICSNGGGGVSKIGVVCSPVVGVSSAGEGLPRRVREGEETEGTEFSGCASLRSPSLFDFVALEVTAPREDLTDSGADKSFGAGTDLRGVPRRGRKSPSS